MKSNVMPSIVQIEVNQLKQLVSEVKETVATGLIQVNKAKRKTASFGVVDLWNVRRGARTAASRRSI
ncbi:MAG: hypothetical protein JWQ30_50 [Sediminibacterium sp.]|nr:hypothetical protein [Sediminibacterium sp.]